MAAFTLPKQRWLVVTEAVWPAKPKLFIIWPFPERVCRPMSTAALGFPGTWLEWPPVLSHQRKTPKQPLKGSEQQGQQGHVLPQLQACIYKGDKWRNTSPQLELPRKCTWLATAGPTAHRVHAESNTGGQCWAFLCLFLVWCLPSWLSSSLSTHCMSGWPRVAYDAFGEAY